MLCTVLIVIAGATNLRGITTNTEAVQTRRGQVYGFSDAPLVEFLEAETRAGDEVFIYPYQPIYYFLEKVKNPTRYSYLQYHFHTDAQFQEAVRDLERKKVRYVVFDTLLSGQTFVQIFPGYRQPEESKLIMEPYLKAHYRLAKDLGRFRILERLN